MKSIESEWTNVYEKMHVVAGRIDRRRRRREEQEEGDQPELPMVDTLSPEI